MTELADIRTQLAETRAQFSAIQNSLGRIEERTLAFAPMEARLRRVELRQHVYASLGSALGVVIGYFVKWHAA